MALLVLPELQYQAAAKVLERPPPAVVHRRVDALTQAFRVKLADKTIAILKSRAKVARLHGRASFFDAVGDSWELKVPRRGDGEMWRLRREEHVRMQIDPKAAGGSKEYVIPVEPVALHTEFNPSRVESDLERFGPWKGVGPKPGCIERATFAPVPLHGNDADPEVLETPGWTIELIWYAQFLAQEKLAKVIDLGWEIASRFGEVLEDRIRRIDLCADVAGFSIGKTDYENFSRKSHVKVYPYTEKPEGDDGFRKTDLEVREVDLPALCDMIAEGKIAGIRVGSGDVVGVVYDKRKELSDSGAKDRLAVEEERWRFGGWNGEDPVTRIEIRIRGDALNEVGARKPECVDPETGELIHLQEYVPRLWSTFATKWLRLTEPGVTRRGNPLPMARRRTDPRWAVLGHIDWFTDCGECVNPACTCLLHQRPIRRVRVRGGASAAQALGAIVSTVGAAGKLHERPPASEEIKDYVEAPNEKLRQMLSILTSWGIDVIAMALIERWGSPESAALHLAIIMNASRARFARAGPKEEPKTRRVEVIARPREGPQLSFWSSKTN